MVHVHDLCCFIVLQDSRVLCAMYVLIFLVCLEIIIFFSFLFSPDDIGTCWYILLSGSVFIKESMFLPRSRYGTEVLQQIFCEA